MSLRLAHLAALCAPLALLACGSLIGLGDLDKADCVSCSGAATSGAAQGGLGAAGGNVASGGVASSVSAGGYLSGSTSGGTPSSGGTSIIVGGTFPNQSGGEGGGAGGEGTTTSGCPGGPMPPFDWKENWHEHTEQLTRVYYDDCIALYFDANVAPATKDWLVPFLDASWSYTLASYGQLGPERLYVVVHQGSKYLGGHSATYGEDTHGHHNVIDMGLESWPAGYYDLPAHLMGFIVDTAGAHTKLGAPKADHYGNQGFPLVYKYDLYVSLGLTSMASSALTQFNSLSNSQPYAGTFWFRDWFYPLWRDHGHAEVFANYMSLLQDYYPVDNAGWMPTMNYGQYIHFMSGAAGEDLEPLARNAFEWHPDFDAELAAAKVDFSAITY